MTESKPRFIYALSEPETGEVRYVGASARPVQRFREHIAARHSRRSQVGGWVAGVQANGVLPVFCILEECDGGHWQEREQHWIQLYQARGDRLFNAATGGAGPPALTLDSWSRNHAACIECGTTERRHAARGLCIRCYGRMHHRQNARPSRPYFGWTHGHAACTECGTTERKHKGDGLCTNCFARRKRRLHHEANPKPQRWAFHHDRCIVCGTTERRHKSHGRCVLCDNRWRNGITIESIGWSKHHPACIECGTTERPHAARGLCRPCYMRQWQRPEH